MQPGPRPPAWRPRCFFCRRMFDHKGPRARHMATTHKHLTGWCRHQALMTWGTRLLSRWRRSRRRQLYRKKATRLCHRPFPSSVRMPHLLLPVQESSHVYMAWRAALFLLFEDVTSFRDPVRERSSPTLRIFRRPARRSQLLLPAVSRNLLRLTSQSSNACCAMPGALGQAAAE